MGGTRSRAAAKRRPEDGDDALALARVRDGDHDAFDELFARHAEGARRLAQSMLRDRDAAEDAVADAFTATFAAIKRGRGPIEGFEPYLRRSVRNQCLRTWRQQSRQRPTAELHDDGPSMLVPATSDGIDQWLDIDVVRSAFRDLPPRMQQVLWQSEVEGRSHAEIGDSTETSAPAIAALAMRSRRELARRYLQHHVAAPGDPELDCRVVREELADLVRDRVSDARRVELDEHLASCPGCDAERHELHRVNRRLRLAPFGVALASFKSSTVLGTIGRLAVTLVPVVGIPAVMATAVVVAVTLPNDTPPPARTAVIAEHRAIDPAEPIVVAPVADAPTPTVVAAAPTPAPPSSAIVRATDPPLASVPPVPSTIAVTAPAPVDAVLDAVVDEIDTPPVAVRTEPLQVQVEVPTAAVAEPVVEPDVAVVPSVVSVADDAVAAVADELGHVVGS